MDLVKKWWFSDIPKYSKNPILSSFDPSTLFACSFFSLQASKMRLVSSERIFENLSEAHEFQSFWFNNGDTVNTKRTVENLILTILDLPTLSAHSLLSLKASKTWLVSFERSFKKLSEAHEYQSIWLNYSNTVNTQGTVKNLIFTILALSTMPAYNKVKRDW